MQYDAIINEEEVIAHESNLKNLKKLQDLHTGIAEKLKRDHCTQAEQQSKLKEMHQAKVRGQHTIETKNFRVLKEIGIELGSYHGGGLKQKGKTREYSGLVPPSIQNASLWRFCIYSYKEKKHYR